MKFGIAFANTGSAAEPEHAAELARLAEDVGMESLWTVEHVVVPAGYESAYPYSGDGRMPGGEQAPIPDPLIWLAYVAAVTSSIRLCTGILILPQRNPVITAKAVATLDRLSSGRVQLGVGVGWLEEEFQALGVPFEQRGARTDEYVGAMRALWTQVEPSFSGDFVDFNRAICLPKPMQSSVPIVVGGHTEASARRAGRLGDGFFPAQGDFNRLGHLFEVARSAARESGRDPNAIEMTTGARRTADEIKALGDLGVDRVVIPPLASSLDDLKDRLRCYSDTVMSKV